MKKTKNMTSAQETMRAAMLSRRSLLKSAVALGAVGLAGPLYIRNALSSSGELNLLMWSDEFPDPVIPNFEKATGIKVNQTPFSQNEEQINKLQATGGEGFDLCQPTRDRAPQFKDLRRSRALRHEPREEHRQPHPLDARRLRRALDLGWRPLSPAALLGFGSHFLAHRPVEGRSRRRSATARCGKRASRVMCRAAALAPARHRPVDGCQRQDAVQPHARRATRTKRTSRRSRTRSLPSPSSTSPGSSSSGIRPTTPSRA